MNNQNEMSVLRDPLLILSIVTSLVFWGLVYSPRLAIILVSSLLIHEYGHYFWMGKEGLKNRRMLMLPPLGAVAYTNDAWDSYEKEANISLAGPIAGMISTIIFAFCYLITGKQFWAASCFVSVVINLFNLVVPIGVLDGGRVLKSISISVSKRLYFGFQCLSVLAIIYIVLKINIFVGIFVGYIWFIDSRRYSRAKLEYERIKRSQRLYLNRYFFITHYPHIFGNDLIEWMRKNICDNFEMKMLLKKIVYMDTMSLSAILRSLSLYLIIIGTYLFFLNWMYGLLDLSSATDIFKYF